MRKPRVILVRSLSFALCVLYLVLGTFSAFAHEADSIVNIYGGTQIKLDIASPIITPATTNWQRQHYEMAVNVRLAKRFYPTAELGYATSGGFMRLGCDISPLKKHPDSPHALLVGVRVATAVQEKGYTDCWGEVVAGCQVQVYRHFYMGWMARLKFLFTRDGTVSYIPGYGVRDNMGWGVNYYLGYNF